MNVQFKNNMNNLRITKKFHFEMAHALWNYNGMCKYIHGHSYKFFVTVIGKPINDEKNPKNGMLMDFTYLKKIVNDKIIKKYDHSLILFKNFDKKLINNIKDERTYFFDFQPTCENLILFFSEKLKNVLPENVKLFSLKLYETENSFSEWYASDNEN